MITQWQSALLDWDADDNDQMVRLVRAYDDGELRPTWYGKVWHVRTSEPYRGSTDFIILPTGNDSQADTIMVHSIQGDDPEESTGEEFRSDDRGVPYEEMMDRLHRRVLENNE